LHIPDGFLSTATSAVAWVGAAGGVGYSINRVKTELTERKVPLIGVTAAFIFAAQMLNFPVAGGTSGHLLGGALAMILLGPFAGSIAITAVLIIQALIFQDGGLLALGANVLNMAVVGVFSAWLVYRGLLRVLGSRKWSTTIAAFAASWASVVLASLAASVELALSGTSPWGVVLPAMGSVHMIIGVGEGLITVGVVSFLRATRPDLLALQATPIRGGVS